MPDAVTQSAPKPSVTIAEGAGQLLRGGYSWSTSPGAATTLTYAFRASATASDFQGFSATFVRFNAEQMKAYELALQAWADVANINFVRVGTGESGDAAYSNNATMLAGGFISSQVNVTGLGVPPIARDRGAQAIDGDTWFNSASNSSVLLPISRNNIGNFVHEIGHALGLDHPGDYGDLDTTPTYDKDAAFVQDTKMYSVMSYFDPSNTGGSFFLNGVVTRYMNTPQLMDVAAVQALYGANTSTRVGDTVYGFNSNADRIWFKATASEQLVFTVWDAGGIDTFDFSGYSTNASIDLNPGAFSSVGLLKNNVAIALGVTIENAIGGAGDDVLRGNAADNRLQGGGGADTLIGGAGWDTAVYGGKASDYRVTQAADGGWTVSDTRAGAPDGVDTLIDMEAVAFADGAVDLSLAFSRPALTTAYKSILTGAAYGSDLLALATLAQKVKGGAITEAQAIADIIQRADTTTSVATLAYQFFTGKIPTSGGIEYLVSPTGPNPNNLNSAYYQSFNLENRYINFAVNLGKAGEGVAKFTADYGGLSLFEATRKAYAAIFGGTPSDTKVHALIDNRADYFAYYGRDGADGIGTKAAMVGWLLAEAQKADLGVMALSNNAWLADLADGSAPFAIDILDPAKGYYRADFVFGGG